MFPPSSSFFNPFSCTDETLFTNPNLTQADQPPPLFLHFPSPFLDCPFIPDQDEVTTTLHETDNTAASNKPSNPNPKRRPAGKKDRHSKIRTAGGVRDRRMRLSVQIAREFFALQDMLGFDRASKTIQWLFAKSMSAIKELTKDIPNGGDVHLGEAEGLQSQKKKRKKTNASKPVSRAQLKESRERARARARERTREKLIIKTLEKSRNPRTSNDDNFEKQQLGVAENLQNFPDAAIPELQNHLGGLGNLWEMESLGGMINSCTWAGMDLLTGKADDEPNPHLHYFN